MRDIDYKLEFFLIKCEAKEVITWHGVNGTDHKGIFFCEGTIDGAVPVARIEVEISRQNADLFQIKDKMAEKTINCGANAIMNFKYGQRKHKTWQLFLSFKWDTESWVGEGDAVTIHNESILR